jgi:hypothetical protein
MLLILAIPPAIAVENVDCTDFVAVDANQIFVDPAFDPAREDAANVAVLRLVAPSTSQSRYQRLDVPSVRSFPAEFVTLPQRDYFSRNSMTSVM